MNAALTDQDATVDLSRLRQRLNTKTTSPTGAHAATQELPEAKVHKFRLNLFTGAVGLLIVSVVSFVWLAVGAIVGDSVPRTIVVVALFVLTIAIIGFCAVIARDYRDRVQLAALHLVQEEIRDAVADMKTAFYTSLVDLQRQHALLRAELLAQLDTLPGRFDRYAEAKVCDDRADAEIAGDGREPPDPVDAVQPVAPAMLSIVRQPARRGS